MALAFFFDMTACVGCKTCQVACKDKNDLPVGTLFRNVTDYEVGEYPMPGLFHMSASCNHCANPACVAACPSGAMYKTEEGPVLHDDALCMGCQACVEACPYSVPKYIEELGVTHKCDTCYGIRMNGYEPQCVSSCPMRALEFGDLATLAAKHPGSVTMDMLACAPESDTLPSTLILAKDIALKGGEEPMQKFF